MKNIRFRFIGAVALFALFFGMTFIIMPDQGKAQTATCSFYTFDHYLRVGSSDATTGGEVSQLQSFLRSTGDYYGPITGYFGALTAQGLRNFKAGEGITFLYGGADFNLSRLDNITRQRILKHCPSYIRSLHEAIYLNQI